MRILRLVTRAFGPLRERGFELDERVALVYGSNEAGKTSFVQALETALYGFEPATRDLHPLALFGGGAQDLELEAELRTSSGELLRIERTLKSRAGLRIAAPGADFEGARAGNHPLTQVVDLPRELFRAVYALSSDDLVELSRNAREHVDQLLLGAKNVAGLRPVYKVREELAEKAQRLWRPDRRGKPQSDELGAQALEARRELGRARAREQELRDALAEKGRLERELDELRDARRELERERAEAEFLREIGELRARQAKLSGVDLSALGGEPLVDPRQLERELKALEARLAEPRAVLARPELALPERERALLEAAARITAHERGAARHDADVEKLEESRRRARGQERKLISGLALLLGRAVAADDLARVATFPVHALRGAIDDWDDGGSAQRDSAGEPAGRRAGAPRGALLAAGLAGTALLALHLAGGLGLAAGTLGAGLLVVALLAALAGAARPAAARAPSAPPEAVTAPIGVLADPRAHAATPLAARRFVERVEALAETAAEAEAERARTIELASLLEEREEEWAALADELGIDSRGSGREVLARLSEALESARRRDDAVTGDAIARERARTAVEAHGPALRRARRHHERLVRTLRANVPEESDLGAAHGALVDRLEESHYLQRLERKLAGDPRWSELRDDARLALAEPPWDVEVARRRDEEQRRIESEIERRNHRLGEIREQLRADEGSRVARAHEHVAALEEQQREVRRRRDRVALLERLVAEADRSWREEHQPDVLRRAGAYVKSITRGRYTALEYPEDARGGLRVTARKLAEPIPVQAPLSRGTRDQIWLALRLGLLDHLDAGRERLPLVLDEALVHFDGVRRRRLYAVLAEVARERQVILCTCHDELAREAEKALVVRRIDLGSGPRAWTGALFAELDREEGE